MNLALIALGYLFVAGVVFRAVQKIIVVDDNAPLEAVAALMGICLLWAVTLPLALACVVVWLVFRAAAKAVDQTLLLFKRDDDNDGS